MLIEPFNIQPGGQTVIYVLDGSGQLNDIDLTRGEGVLLADTRARGMIAPGSKLWVAQISSAQSV